MNKKFNTDEYINKILNTLEGLKMQFPKGIASSELKERLARYKIACHNGILTMYIKNGVFTKLGGGSRTSYLIHPDLKNIVAAHEAYSKKNIQFRNKPCDEPCDKPKHNWKRVIKSDDEIAKAIELLEKNNYFVRKIHPGVIISFKEVLQG